jgi:molybdate transport system ATP-binding protein
MSTNDAMNTAGTLEARFHATFGNFTLDVELRAPGRGVTAIVGPSGCGKSTLLRCIAGLERVANGYLHVNDEIWQQGRTFVPTHQRALGYVFQEASLFPHLDVRGNLDYGWRRTPRAQRHVDFDEVVQLLGIETLLTQRPDTLSGGQRQRVAIGRALLASPRLLLMDEPLASLDLDSRAEILPYLERLHDELDIPMLFISHAPAEVAQLADQLALMANGRILASGPINEMLTRSDLPASQQEEASAVLEGQIIDHDRDYQLMRIAVPGGQMSVALRDVPVGHRVRVRILARDVSIALQRPIDTSISNILPARIIDITEIGDGPQALVRLDLGGTVILSRITRRSVATLQLRPNLMVHAQVKSVALMH